MRAITFSSSNVVNGTIHDWKVNLNGSPNFHTGAKVECKLTDVGRSLIEPLSALSEWVQRSQYAIERQHQLREILRVIEVHARRALVNGIHIPMQI